MFWMVVAGLIFASFMAIVRYVGSEMHPAQTSFMRYALGLVFMLPFFLRMRMTEIKKANFKLHIFRGLLHAFGVLSWFYAMSRIPIAEVTALGFTAPVFATIGAILMLGEKVRIRRLAAVCFGLLGAVIILKPGFVELDNGAIAMLIAAPIFAVADLVAKLLLRQESGPAVVGYLSVVVTIVLAGPAIYFWRTPTNEEWVLLTITAGLATLGHLCFTHAFKIAEMSAIQPAKFVQLMWSALVGYLVFAEVPETTTWIGAAVIVGSIWYIGHREALARRRGEDSVAPSQTSSTSTG
ncbi:MAG: DMT family transporter [Rhodospirillaceae bacterium]|jgi:drug/metabolite transporter (DMT)-like permease|nr:DMT family transporter [Rhodospirillaceae bacterium]MBT6139407.1 DMT family transporter [Rhodospirillaceae bacterium]